MTFWKTGDFLPNYDDWKTTERMEKPEKPGRDPDLAREDAIERKQLDAEKRRALENLASSSRFKRFSGK